MDDSNRSPSSNLEDSFRPPPPKLSMDDSFRPPPPKLSMDDSSGPRLNLEDSGRPPLPTNLDDSFQPPPPSREPPKRKKQVRSLSLQQPIGRTGRTRDRESPPPPPPEDDDDVPPPPPPAPIDGEDPTPKKRPRFKSPPPGKRFRASSKHKKAASAPIISGVPTSSSAPTLSYSESKTETKKPHLEMKEKKN